MDPLAKKLGDKAAQAVRQQVKDISEEVKEIPKSGSRLITGKDEEATTDSQTDKSDNTQNAKQQFLTLLRGNKKQTNKQTQQAASQQQLRDDSAPQKPKQDYLDREIEKARREREEKEKQRDSNSLQQEQMQDSQEEKAFVQPKGRKPRGMQNPMARKGKQKHELGKTAKG